MGKLATLNMRSKINVGCTCKICYVVVFLLPQLHLLLYDVHYTKIMNVVAWQAKSTPASVLFASSRSCLIIQLFNYRVPIVIFK